MGLLSRPSIEINTISLIKRNDSKTSTAAAAVSLKREAIVNAVKRDSSNNHVRSRLDRITVSLRLQVLGSKLSYWVNMLIREFGVIVIVYSILGPGSTYLELVKHGKQ